MKLVTLVVLMLLLLSVESRRRRIGGGRIAGANKAGNILGKALKGLVNDIKNGD
jgi:hypothetical protein